MAREWVQQAPQSFIASNLFKKHAHYHSVFYTDIHAVPDGDLDIGKQVLDRRSPWPFPCF
jgi:hypothetical protein